MMEWCCWISSVFVFSSLLFEKSNGDFTTGAIHAVRCTLVHTEPSNCNTLPEILVPSYLVKAFHDAPPSLHKALRYGRLSQLSSEQLGNLPLSIFYLIPRTRMSELNGTQLAAVLEQHGNDTSLAQQVMASLHKHQLLALMSKLDKVDSLTQEVVQVVGEFFTPEALNDKFFSSLSLEKAFLAYLRPSVLLTLDDSTFHRVIQHLRIMDKSNMPKKETIPVIAHAALRHDHLISKVNWLVMGLTPDDISNESIDLDLNVTDFKLDLSIMQARSIFQRKYQNKILKNSHAIDCLPLLPKLSPVLLQKFPSVELKYDMLSGPQFPIPASLPTACQLREYVMAYCELTGFLRTEEPWGSGIRCLKQWVFTLPLTSLKEYLQDSLTTSRLQSLDTPAISNMQAYYLTGRGTSLDVRALNSVMELHSFLRALPASQLISRKVGELSSDVLHHLVANLPADNLPRTLSLIYKIASSLGSEVILEKLLENRDVNAIMSMVSPKDLILSGPMMLKVFSQKHRYSSVIRQLPQPILTALLDQAKESSGWSWQSLLDSSQVSHLLIGGLTCQHIEEMDTGYFIPIMAQYNKHRRQAFPKNLQHCCLRKLISQLKLKMTLTQTDMRYGLLAMLEPIEIVSVGGYVLVDLPVDAVKASPYRRHMLTAIGKLTNAELMLAANKTHLHELAKLAIDKEGNVDAFIAGNLIWYLPNITNNISGLKLMLESELLDRTVCLSSDARQYFATTLIKNFGPMDKWSAGTLATLNDLLIMFTNDELYNISKAVWIESADCLKSHYSDNVHWIQPMPFYQVCGMILGESEAVQYNSSVSHLARWLLRAAQWQLNTVSHVSDARIKNNMIHVNDLNSDIDELVDVFNPEVVTEPEKSTTSYISQTEDSVTTEVTQITEEIATVRSTSESTAELASTETSTSTTEKSTHRQTMTKESTNFEEKVTTPYKKESTSYLSSSSKLEIGSTTPSIEKVSHKNESDSTKLTPTDPSIIEFPRNNSVSKLNNGETPREKMKEDKYGASTETNEISINPTLSWVNTSSIKKETDKTTISSTTSIITDLFANNVSNIINREKPTEKTIFSAFSNTENGSNKTKNNMTKPITLQISDNASLSTQTNTSSNFNFTVENKINNNASAASLKNNTEAMPVQESNSMNSTNRTVYNPSENTSILTTTPSNHEQDENSDISKEDYDDDYDNETTIPSNIKEYEEINNNSRAKRNSIQTKYNFELTCNALKMVGKLSALALTKEDIKLMSDTEVEDCLQELGAMELGEKLQKEIWLRVKKKEGVHLLGKLVQVINVGDLWDLLFDISKPWALENIYTLIKNVNNSYVFERLLRSVVRYNSNYPPELLAVLGPAVCSLEPDNLRSLSVVGFEPMNFCPVCLPLLAEKAVQDLGPVSQWRQHHVHVLHNIIAGLQVEDWKTLIASSYQPLRALQPSAVKCLNVSHIEVLNPDQIKQIPPMTLLALSQQQVAVLNSTQFQAFWNCTRPHITEKLAYSDMIFTDDFTPSKGSYCGLATTYIVNFIVLFHILNYV